MSVLQRIHQVCNVKHVIIRFRQQLMGTLLQNSSVCTTLHSSPCHCPRTRTDRVAMPAYKTRSDAQAPSVPVNKIQTHELTNYLEVLRKRWLPPDSRGGLIQPQKENAKNCKCLSTY